MSLISAQTGPSPPPSMGDAPSNVTPDCNTKFPLLPLPPIPDLEKQFSTLAAHGEHWGSFSNSQRLGHTPHQFNQPVSLE